MLLLYISSGGQVLKFYPVYIFTLFPKILFSLVPWKMIGLDKLFNFWKIKFTDSETSQLLQITILYNYEYSGNNLSHRNYNLTKTVLHKELRRRTEQNWHNSEAFRYWFIHLQDCRLVREKYLWVAFCDFDHGDVCQWENGVYRTTETTHSCIQFASVDLFGGPLL